ncbi:MAG: hypothetical protein JXR19_00615 [Bacteroidia bacterium]
MKHLVAILAHKAKSQLNYLIDALVEQGFEVIIHLDQKNSAELKTLLGNRVKYCIPQELNVKRGHYSLLLASLHLLEHSMNFDFDYYHLISGEDLPVKSAHGMNELLSITKGASFINHNKLPINSKQEKKEKHTIFKDYSEFKDQIPLSNYEHFAFKNGIGLVNSRQFQENSLFTQLTKKLHGFRSYWKLYHTIFKRKSPPMDYYAGSAWYSLHRDLVKALISKYKTEPHLLEYFKYVGFPDEIFIQSISQNLNYNFPIINSDLRYISWDSRTNQGPSYLNKEIGDVLKNSNAFFARKWDIASKEEFHQIYHYLCSKEAK